MRREYHHIISLGSSCRTAYQIRSAFPGARGYPFDWWISPLAATLRFLDEPDPTKLYHPDYLEPVIEQDKIGFVRNKYYGTHLFHEFPRQGGGVVPDYLDYVDAPRQKTARRVRRLRAIEAGSPTLFVLHAGIHDPKNPAVWVAGMEDMCRTLEVRYGLENFDILLINTPIAESYGRVVVERFDDVGLDWRGNNAAWAELLASVAGLSIRDRGARSRARMSGRGRRRGKRRNAASPGGPDEITRV